MIKKLNKNRHKRDGYKDKSTWWLWAKMQEEITELQEALRQDDRAAITEECADVANVAMFIAAVAGDLEK